MGINYPSLAATAKRLIGNNGTKCVLVNPSSENKEYDKDTNRYEGGEPERFGGYCIISNYEDRLVDGTVIKAGDRRVVAVTTGEPQPGTSTLEVYDKTGKVLKETYKVINSNPISPDAETIIVCRLHCRK